MKCSIINLVVGFGIGLVIGFGMYLAGMDAGWRPILAFGDSLSTWVVKALVLWALLTAACWKDAAGFPPRDELTGDLLRNIRFRDRVFMSIFMVFVSTTILFILAAITFG